MNQEDMDNVCAEIVSKFDSAQHEEGNVVYVNINGFDLTLTVEPM